MPEWPRLAELSTVTSISPPPSAPATTRRTGAAEPGDLVRPGARAADVVTFERAVVGFFVDAADLLGVPKSVAAIYGICFASPEPLGFSEINERLDISSGSISQGLKLLREVGALKLSTAAPAGSPSSQLLALSSSLSARARFEPDLELRKLILHFIGERLEKQFVAGKTRLKAMKAAVPAGQNGCRATLSARVRALRSWHDKGQALLPIIKAFLKLT